MYITVQAVALVVPLLHPSLPAAAADLHPTPIIITGVACSSPHDMVGLYAINATSSVKNAGELLALGDKAGLSCQLLQNAVVFNWGQVAVPDGSIQASTGKPIPIVEVMEPEAGVEHHFFLVAKTK